MMSKLLVGVYNLVSNPERTWDIGYLSVQGLPANAGGEHQGDASAEISLERITLLDAFH